MMISKIIAAIKATSSKNEKLSILKENAENDVLKLACKLTYSPRIQFWMTVPKNDRALDSPDIGFFTPALKEDEE